MSKQNVSILKLALRKLKEKKSDDITGEVEDTSDADLQAAMEEFESATNPADKAKAFKAAIDLARDSD